MSLTCKCFCFFCSIILSWKAESETWCEFVLVVFCRNSAVEEQHSTSLWISRTRHWSAACSTSAQMLTAWTTAASRRTTSRTGARMKRSAASCTRGRRRSWGTCPTANQTRATWRIWTCRKMRSVSDWVRQNYKAQAESPKRFQVITHLRWVPNGFYVFFPTDLRWHKVWKVNRTVAVLVVWTTVMLLWGCPAMTLNEGRINSRPPTRSKPTRAGPGITNMNEDGVQSGQVRSRSQNSCDRKQQDHDLHKVLLYIL